MEVGPKPVGTAVIDVHEKVVIFPLNLGEIFGLKMGNFVLLAKGPKAIHPGRIRSVTFAEDDGYFHR
jgi:hypothetical protein